MIRHTIAAATLLTAAPLLAQSTTQEALDARYDRALAAGYKALFMCSGLSTAGRLPRSYSSIEEWELTGVDQRFDNLMAELVAKPVFTSAKPIKISRVSVEYSEGTPARFAVYRERLGCALAPIGTLEAQLPAMFPEMDWVERSVQFISPYNQEWMKTNGWEAAFDGTYGERTRTTVLLVQRDGKIVTGAYAKGFDYNAPQRTWSVAKSMAASVVGAAVFRGDVGVQNSAGLGLDETDPRRAITIDHLLRMASGRYSDTPGNRTDPLYWGGSTVDETAAHWPLIHAPGTVYRYANNDTLMAIEAISDTFDEHPPAEFFARIGMDHTVAETDWQGDYVLSSQVWSTARDLAKLGQLYLDDGVLPDGKRILPENWVEYVSSPSGPQPEGPFGYGAGFWLFNNSDGVPPDTFAAMGNRGQFTVIVPSMNVVIVRRGEDPAGSRFDIAAFTRDVLETLAE